MNANEFIEKLTGENVDENYIVELIESFINDLNSLYDLSPEESDKEFKKALQLAFCGLVEASKTFSIFASVLISLVKASDDDTTQLIKILESILFTQAKEIDELLEEEKPHE